MARCLRTLLGFVQKAEVDPKWRLDKVGNLVIGYNYAFGTLLAFESFQIFISAGGELTLQLALLSAAVLALTNAVLLHVLSRRLSRRAHVVIFETIEMITWLVAPTLMLIGEVKEPDDLVRNRGFVMILVIGVCPPLLLGVRLSLYSILAVACLITQTVCFTISENYFGRQVRVPTLMTNFILVAFFVVLAVWHGRLLVSLQLAEERLRQQQKASQRLVSMLCDAWCLVGGDRETVVDSDGRFDSLMGRAMVGVRMPEVFPADQDHGDQLAVFQAFMAEAAAMEDDHTGSVRPMTLVSVSGATVQVTVFAVKQKAVVPSESGSYLLGICQTLEEERGDVVPSLFQNAAADRGPPAENTDLDFDLLSTATGSTDCFRCDDLDSVQKAIARIAELGRNEHWTIEPEEVDLKLESMGTGSFGTVVPGTYYGAQVVVKLVKGFDPSSSLKALSSLCHELRILRHCRHPNLVHFKGAVCDMTLHQIGLVLEYVDDGDLYKWMTTGPMPSEATRFRVMVGVCRGLWHLHSHRPVVVHSDLKPHNVLVATRGQYVQAKLADFGLASLQLRRGPRRGGTLRWMPPEAYQGTAVPAPVTDIFSYGRLMEFLIVGRVPLMDMRKEQLKAMLASGVVVPPKWSETPSVLQWCCQPMVEACLKVDRNARPHAKQLHGLLMKLPAERFDDDRGSAAKTIRDGSDAQPWGQALAEIADVSSSSHDGLPGDPWAKVAL